jgi:hypothetical protein
MEIMVMAPRIGLSSKDIPASVDNDDTVVDDTVVDDTVSPSVVVASSVNEGPFDALVHVGGGEYVTVEIGQSWPTVSAPSAEETKEA